MNNLEEIDLSLTGPERDLARGLSTWDNRLRVIAEMRALRTQLDELRSVGRAVVGWYDHSSSRSRPAPVERLRRVLAEDTPDYHSYPPPPRWAITPIPGDPR